MVSFPSWNREYAQERATAGPRPGQLLRQAVYKSNSEIFIAGGYVTEAGNQVVIPVDDPMLESTKVYSAMFDVNGISEKCSAVSTSVINGDCLEVARELQKEGYNPAVMNLADAYTACGWYKRGSKAQEEALCRATTLSRSLFQFFIPKSGKKNRYVEEANVSLKDIAYPMDINFGGIYSPGVTVFRNTYDLYSLMEACDTYKVGIISVAALDFNEKHGKNLEYKSDDGGFTLQGLEIMKNKIRTIYRIALSNGHDSLVAGAFGCGAFRLPCDKVSQLFKEIMEEEEFRNKFRKITFAIIHNDGEDGKYAPFYRLFNN
jgi:uncharacterized protein (TIGR02452 family)